MTEFTKSGIHNLQNRRAAVQTKVRDVRADVTIDSLKHTQPIDHPPIMKTSLYKASGLKVNF